jgi:hypothetical protein
MEVSSQLHVVATLSPGDESSEPLNREVVSQTMVVVARGKSYLSKKSNYSKLQYNVIFKEVVFSKNPGWELNSNCPTCE